MRAVFGFLLVACFAGVSYAKPKAPKPVAAQPESAEIPEQWSACRKSSDCKHSYYSCEQRDVAINRKYESKLEALAKKVCGPGSSMFSPRKVSCEKHVCELADVEIDDKAAMDALGLTR